MEHEILERMKEIASSIFHCPVSSLNDKTDLVKSFRAMPIDLARIVAKLEAEYGIDINYKEFYRYQTLGDAAAYVAGLF